LRFTWFMRSRTSGNAGSGPLVSPDAHTFWLGQPSQAADLPASSDSVPLLRVGRMSTTNRRTVYVADLLDNVLAHSLAQISGLECLLVAVARPTS
jgi:hypothetical protein